MMCRRALICLGILAATGLAGCDGGEDVTARSLANARRVWNASKVRDYDLEWTTGGERESHYLAYVRGGEVKSVRQFLDDRRENRIREVEARAADPSYYGVDGLFKILEEERAQLLGDEPFGKPKGTSVLLKFTPDRELGFPRRYRRDVVGSSKGLSIDVVRFVPNPKSGIPPLAP